MDSYSSNPYSNDSTFSVAAMAAADERAAFITKTYVHLVAAVGALVAIEAVLLQTGLGMQMVGMISGGFGWLIVLGAFMLVSTVANRWAQSSTSVSKQYMGLGLYVVAEAVILLPILSLAQDMGIAQSGL